MADYDNEMRGILFKNDQKGNEKAPWYKGKIQIQGVEYELAAWVQESKRDGSKFLSLKIDGKRERQEELPQAQDMGDDVPF